jgi:protein-tyrosine phosphatase
VSAPSTVESSGEHTRSLRDFLRPAVYAVRRAAYRTAHPWRRRRALRLLRSAAPVRSVAFICLGNICRSPYAAAVMAERLGHVEGLRIGSAGLLRGGRASPAEAVAVAAERGYDLEPHRSRPVDAAMMSDFDLLVVMEGRQKRALLARGARDPDRILVLGDLDPTPAAGQRTIRDPFGMEEDGFRHAYDRIDRCMDVLVQALEPGGP